MDDDVELNEKILYDLSIYSEWRQESETVFRAWKEKQNVTLPRWVTSMTQRSVLTVLRIFGFCSSGDSSCLLPTGLVKLMNNHLHWHFDVSQDAKHVAILQDTDLEVRSSYDGYSSVTGKVALSKKDPFPQWRKVSWNVTGDMVACSDSLGNVLVFDTLCTPICSISSNYTPPPPNTPADLGLAISGLIFKQCKPDQQKWHSELMVINYRGTLMKYLIRSDGEYRLVHTFTFSRYYPQGIGAVIYHPKHDMLLVGGCGDIDVEDIEMPACSKYGVSAWRMLSDEPHYTRITDYEQDCYEALRKRKCMRKLKSIYKLTWLKKEEQDGVCGIALSPSGHMLACIHQSGRFSIWDIPSLRLRQTWALEEQPGFDDVNQTIAENPKKRKMMREHLIAFWLADTKWWDDQSVIMSRGTGAVTINYANNLKNLLGTQPEWFEPAPLLSQSQDGGGFLSLECECKYESLKRHLSDSSDGSGSEEEYEDSEDELDFNVIQKSTRAVKYGLYYVTDMERFQPPRKKPKLVTRTYRLLSLKSTTPEELYTKKINNEEYGEALLLARAYGLDTDRVYKRQWEKTPVSIASIQDYLSKISKRSWVLHECLDRVPVNIDAMRELLKYGLRGTDLEALITIGKGEDEGRFIFCDTGEAYEESIDTFDEDAMEERKEREQERQQESVKEVDFTKLKLDQRELCRARVKLLQYLDRLSTYEEILGGINAAEEHYDYKFFEDFRRKNIVELALDYTRKCDWRALDTLFCYHGSDLLPHRLAILANFPETFCPTEYRALLPEASRGNGGDSEVVEWKEYHWREDDWVEFPDIRKVIDPTQIDFGALMYEECPQYLHFQNKELTRGHLTEWYIQRAKEIEVFSRQVDHALELVNLGIELNVDGLEELQDDLITMETLVYECLIDDSLSLKDLQSMPDIDRLRLMMSRSSEEMYVKNVRRWMVPFLDRCERKQPTIFYELLREYMLSIARTDLTLCLKMFETSKATVSQPVMSDEMELIPLALDCIYNCKENDQLSNAFGILECLPQKGFGIVSEALSRLHSQIDDLECHLSAAELLEKHNVPQTVAYIKDSQNDTEKAKQLLVKITRVAGRREPAPCEEDWRELLNDMLTLRSKIYRCVNSQECYEIFVKSLLTSGRHGDIALAGKMVESTKKESLEPDYMHLENEHYGSYEKVSYKKAIGLVLSAAREYFDSSADMADSNMDLARACLALIKDGPKEVQLETDLIESLALLDGFGVKALPIQVRMSKDKLDFVKKAIEEKPYTYKNAQRLLKLGKMLHISGLSEKHIEGQVLRVVIQHAIKAKDISVATTACRQLMEMGYEPVWEECKQLAEMEENTDIKSKCVLLSFAVTHCTAEMIEPILRAKCLLETQIAYESVQKQMSSSSSSAGRDSESPPVSHISVTNALQQTKNILSSTNQATRAVLSNVQDKAWWKKTIKSIHTRGKQDDDTDSGNDDFSNTGYHPFYGTLVEANGYENKSEADYRNMRIPKIDRTGKPPLSELIFRTGKLEESLTDGQSFHPATEVLLQLAQDTIMEDTTLGLAYLLALPKAEDADKCFENCPKTGVSLQTMTYYYALQIYRHLQKDKQPRNEIDFAYLHNPLEVTAKVLKLVRQKGAANSCPELGERLQAYNEKLLDYIQAQILLDLGRGVDVERFTDDAEYKKETILGLAMSTESEVYDIAVNLAKRYNIPMWDLYMAHLEFLFESELPVSEIKKRVAEQSDLLSTLKSKPGEFTSRMKTYVYPTLPGSDHEVLTYYYGLLEGCQPEGEVDPQAHVSVLRKVSSFAKGLDYKKLTDPEENALEVIQPVLTPKNIVQLAKILGKVPTENGDFLQPSIAYCGWALKQFWEGVVGSKKNIEPESDTDWIHRYESCHEFINKLNATDFIQFVDGVLFSQQSAEKLSPGCRQELLKRALKFTRQQTTKSKEGNSEWNKATDTLQGYQQHIQLLCTDIMAELWHSSDPTKQHYAKVFSSSKTKPERTVNLYKEMAIDGQTPEFIKEILDTVHAGKTTGGNVMTVYKDAVAVAIQAFKDPMLLKTVLKRKPCTEALKMIIFQVSVHVQNGGDLVSGEDIMTILRPFCRDSSIDVSVRKTVLETMRDNLSLVADDERLLLYYMSDEIILPLWPDFKITEDDVEADKTRQKLFDQLLMDSVETKQFMSLAKLTQTWPPLAALTAQSKNPEKHPYCQVIRKMLLGSDDCSSHIIHFMKSIQVKHGLSEQCLSYLSSLLFANDLVVASVKCVLLWDYIKLYEGAVEKLQLSSEAEEDTELFTLILKRRLFTRIVPTMYYKKLTEYVLAQNRAMMQAASASEQQNTKFPRTDENIESLVPEYLQVSVLTGELEEAGYSAEAQALMTEYKGSNTGKLGKAFKALSGWSGWLGK